MSPVAFTDVNLGPPGRPAPPPLGWDASFCFHFAFIFFHFAFILLSFPFLGGGLYLYSLLIYTPLRKILSHLLFFAGLHPNCSYRPKSGTARSSPTSAPGVGRFILLSFCFHFAFISFPLGCRRAARPLHPWGGTLPFAFILLSFSFILLSFPFILLSAPPLDPRGAALSLFLINIHPSPQDSLPPSLLRCACRRLPSPMSIWSGLGRPAPPPLGWDAFILFHFAFISFHFAFILLSAPPLHPRGGTLHFAFILLSFSFILLS